jgi:hypothetical protein
MGRKDPNAVRWLQRAPRPQPDEAVITARRDARRRFRHAVMAAIPVAMVNATAFIGQFAFIRVHVPWILPGQVLAALTFESVAVTLAWHAHVAAMRNDSATRLKLGAYLVALVMGGMNYSHYAGPHWRPTVMAVGLAMMSAMSPWLWGIHTRRASRDKLMALGLLEPHAVRLGANRWTWHPLRSSRVMYWATWHGVNEPARAIGHFAARYGTADTPELARAGRTAIPRATSQLAVPPAPPVPAPGRPAAPDVPEHAVPSVPDVPALAPSGVAHVPAGYVPVTVPGGTTGAYMDPVPAAELSASASLEASATLSGGRPSQAVITAVELELAGTGLDDLPSVRSVARRLGHEQNCRRLAKRLIDARVKAGTSLAGAPASERIEARPANGAARPGSNVIATPVQYLPGGSQGHD